MAVDMFLKIDGIKGESVDDKHKDEIVIESFSFGQAANVDSEKGQRTGKLDMQDFHFVMAINAASPPLMDRCATGEHIKEALLTCRKAGATPAEFLKIKFIDLMVSSFQNAGAQADLIPTDQFSIWFAKIELEYRETDPKGQLGPSVFFKWDRIKGERY